ncbi:MAG: DUF1178 family protein [Rhizobiaceae bacterium]
MISFNLCCEHDHEFEGWFSSSDDFDAQLSKGLVTCPFCDSASVVKSLMAPTVSTARKKEKLALSAAQSLSDISPADIKTLRDKLIDGSENVGRQFPEEARKIHYGETEARTIHGEADRKEVEALLEEGVGIVPIPTLPEDIN